MPLRKNTSAVTANRDATRRRASPKPKKRRSTTGKRGWSKLVRLGNETAIIDGQHRMSVLRFYFENLDRLGASSADKSSVASPRTKVRRETVAENPRQRKTI